MKCNHKTEGFVAFGGDITGLIKSCATEARILQADKSCAGIKCDVYPDRARCCRDKKCVCSNGDNAKGDDCAEDSQHDCEHCSTGYYMSADAGAGAQTCIANTCKCPGGTFTTGANCATEGSTDCSECNAGYEKTDGPNGAKTCVPNNCTCLHGGPSTAANADQSGICMKNEDADCASCDSGYEPVPQFAQNTLTTCAASTCAQDTLPSGTKLDSSQCDSKTTDETCSVSCAGGYTGTSQTYTCGANGKFTGTAPECVPNKCEKKSSAACFPRNTVSGSCEEKTTGDNCKVTCSTGYGSNSQTYTCEADGWKCSKIVECLPDPCAVDTDIANGDKGKCGSSLTGDGASCDIDCSDGYKVSGKMSCTAGELTKATCVEEPCTGAAVLGDGYATNGNCEDPLASRATCKPKCAAGYSLKDDTSCLKGTLTAGVCESDLKCTLTFKQELGTTDKGYWSEDENHMDYAGCEKFCTQKNANGQDKDKITGCELSMVPGANRDKKGKFCFAHIGQVALSEKDEYAACVVAQDLN